ncbi:GNAT family N-acetyltransferase [Paracoccus sp. M683]|uniref:GNAT family N-acetyltransferase n=1 Tax=Paracoccus sp. M683 TaxID=2594268 RepID=UPI00117C9AA3|nr:GNAT family N-acetyltransferase [Paracoccus sp. M683]TRW96754.1 GNAT family N-acetyltransferase [Paracoccus sp. M683]
MNSFTIQDARFPADIGTVRHLFRAYAEWLGIDLDFQGFEAELASLPGRYAGPDGALLLLHQGAAGAGDAQPATGCVAMRRLDGETCEMKRLYLDTTLRGSGMGRALGQAIITRAREAGYRRMVLDTLDHMGAALRLYERLGFQPIAPYYSNPLPGAVYLGLDL